MHLHPSAQRNLKNVLLALSQGSDQIFINTHSSVLIANDEPNQTIFKVEKHGGETEIKPTAQREKPYVVFELLGGSPHDLLLPPNFLIVEGRCEFYLLTKIIERFYSDKPSIHVLEAKGDITQAERTINSIEKVFTPLNTSIYKDKIVLMLDNPSPKTEGSIKQFLSTYKNLTQNKQIFILPQRDIEQCYPNQPCPTYGNWRKSQAELDAEDERGKKIINAWKKTQLAKYVRQHMAREQFETEMKVCFQALTRCWELSYLN